MGKAKSLSGHRGAAIYARYSSDLQDARSIDDQVARLRERIERDGGAADEALVFSDSAESGSLWDRPGLQALLVAVQQNQVGKLYVEDISRLSRDVEDSARIRKRLEFHDVRLVSVGDGIELGNGSAGTITTSGFTVVNGDALDTTNTNKFLLFITKIASSSVLTVQALQ